MRQRTSCRHTSPTIRRAAVDLRTRAARRPGTRGRPYFLIPCETGRQARPPFQQPRPFSERRHTGRLKPAFAAPQRSLIRSETMCRKGLPTSGIPIDALDSYRTALSQHCRFSTSNGSFRENAMRIRFRKRSLVGRIGGTDILVAAVPSLPVGTISYPTFMHWE